MRPGGRGGGPQGGRGFGGGPQGGRGFGSGGGPRLPGGREEECSTVTLLCRGVDLTHIAPTNNTAFIYVFERNLKANSLFMATNSELIGVLTPDDVTFKAKTFLIQAKVTPRRPLKL